MIVDWNSYVRRFYEILAITFETIEHRMADYSSGNKFMYKFVSTKGIMEKF